MQKFKFTTGDVHGPVGDGVYTVDANDEVEALTKIKDTLHNQKISISGVWFHLIPNNIVVTHGHIENVQDDEEMQEFLNEKNTDKDSSIS
ncbi:hypothetical protein FACS1894166_11170 [Bacilli bacterium]|nr:hypothetical protein FACS1894166_11170 [Bacilli bacterium]